MGIHINKTLYTKMGTHINKMSHTKTGIITIYI